MAFTLKLWMAGRNTLVCTVPKYAQEIHNISKGDLVEVTFKKVKSSENNDSKSSENEDSKVIELPYSEPKLIEDKKKGLFSKLDFK